MNRDVLIFLLVLLVAGLIGGFVGAELSGYDRTFSPTGAVVGAIGTGAVLLGLGAFFDRQDRMKRQQKLPDDIRGVFDRMFGRKSSQPQSIEAVLPSPSVDTSRELGSVDPVKVRTFVAVMSRLGSLKDQSKIETVARAKLRSDPDPVVAALRAQREFLDVLLDRSRGNPSVMGSSIANSCFGLCEMVVEGTVPDEVGREYFNRYIKVFERVHGIKMPFSGGPLDYDTSLEIARESLSKKG